MNGAVKDSKRIIWMAVWYLLLTAMVSLFILPFLWMISAAFKTPQQCVAFPPVWIPNPVTLRAFRQAFTSFPFVRYITNSVFVTFSCIAGTLLSCSLVAFGFARIQAPLKNLFFTLLLSSMMIPGFVTLLPVFTLYVRIQWINTYLPLIVPSFLACSGFSIFMLRQFFMSFPKELDEAAQIDGCSYFGILYRMLIPNSKTVLFIVALFTFVGCWNDFFGPMIFLSDRNRWTLAVGLIMFKSGYGATLDLGPMMSVALVSVLPIMFLYFVAQKYFVQGIVTTGLKG